jgi:nucleotide-binding universal stress UspA family protein
MSWNPIVVGVDSSPESARAAAVAVEMAAAAGTSCHLLHVIRDEWSALAIAELPERAEEFRGSLLAQAREQVERTLWGVVPPDAILNLRVRVGRTGAVLKQTAAELGAGLIVLGGKHHSTLARWLGGSTSHDMVRTTDVPVLVTGGSQTPIRRVLAAVDMSAAARPTIQAAERFATLSGAELRVVCALEPLPVIPDTPNYDLTHYYGMLEDHLVRHVWPLVESRNCEKVTRYGTAVDVVVKDAADWRADLVVVGSHGKGWVDRLLIGSVTERLLNHLPTSLLVVPVYSLVATEAQARQSAPRGAFA